MRDLLQPGFVPVAEASFDRTQDRLLFRQKYPKNHGSHTLPFGFPAMLVESFSGRLLRPEPTSFSNSLLPVSPAAEAQAGYGAHTRAGKRE